MMKNSVVRPRLAAVGAPMALLVIFLATLVPFLLMDNEVAREAFPYVYSAGALALLLVRLFTPFKGTDLKLKGWHRIESWTAIIFCVAAFFLFYNPHQLRDWLAFTLAGAVLQAITSIAIPAREKKLG
ncbi:MAG: hypothetical protein K2L92_03635 [Muribaculaceae bacterium]|nr:hypothetical protein [Muribaculaceae bacterium]